MLLSALNQKRFIRFKKNKRGWYSLILFSVLFLFSLCAEFIPNEKPIFIQYNNTFYFPVLQRYPETEFGGEFPLDAYHNSRLSCHYRQYVIYRLVAYRSHVFLRWPRFVKFRISHQS